MTVVFDLSKEFSKFGNLEIWKFLGKNWSGHFQILWKFGRKIFGTLKTALTRGSNCMGTGAIGTRFGVDNSSDAVTASSSRPGSTVSRPNSRGSTLSGARSQSTQPGSQGSTIGVLQSQTSRPGSPNIPQVGDGDIYLYIRRNPYNDILELSTWVELFLLPVPVRAFVVAVVAVVVVVVLLSLLLSLSLALLSCC